MKTKVKAFFSGLPKAELLEDGRTVRMLESFSFTDSSGVEWKIEKGDEPDGSSIPRLFWRVFGSPFVGKHRFASFPHDKYCKLREKSGRTHEQVHRMYFDACICAGVNYYKAKVMYFGVKLRGPKW